MKERRGMSDAVLAACNVQENWSTAFCGKGTQRLSRQHKLQRLICLEHSEDGGVGVAVGRGG